MKYPSDMDIECVTICDALNEIPGITTFESCCGHGRDKFRVFFTAETIAALLPIVVCANSSAWHVEASSATETKNFGDIVTFMLEGPVGPAAVPGGANDYAGWIRDVLSQGTRKPDEAKW